MSDANGGLGRQLEDFLRTLEETIGRFQVRAVNLISDLVVLGFAREVFENAYATLILSRSDVPRAGNICARSALEALLDLLFLVTRPESTYDMWAARARAGEVLDREYAAELASQVKTGPHDGVTEEGLKFNVDASIEIEAEAWESYAEGKGEVLRRAVEAVRADRKKRRWHWTGYRRSELPRQIHEESGAEFDSFVKIIESWYNLLSIEAHPAPRLFAEQLQQEKEGQITIKVTPEDVEEHARLTNVGVGAALVAARGAVHALSGFLGKTRDETR